jgi:ribosomal subunit interface protein
METTAAIQDHVERRILFAVGRFAPRVEEVSVRLGDANGPRGGNDKTCRTVASLHGVGQVVVEDADADLYAAVDRAASRLGRTVARAVDRRRDRPAGRSLAFSSLAPLFGRRDPVLGME